MKIPKFFLAIAEKKVTKKQFAIDIRAGISVAIISLPLCIALGISSGVTPQVGLISAIIAGTLTAIFSGSSVQIGGPTGAFVVVVFGIIAKYGLEGLIISTIMGGIILIVLGFLRLGSLVEFIPYSITVGFAAGVGMILATSEIQNFFGLKIDKVPTGFIDKWISYITHMNTINYWTLIIGIISIAIILLWPKVTKAVPGSLIALIIATLIVKFMNLDVATIGTCFGDIKASIPTLRIPHVNIDLIKTLIGPAITIALLSAISSLLSCVVSDEKVGEKHDSNTELIAQGIANIGSALFGGIPTAGVVARTTANIRGGAKTPIAGITHGVALLIIMLVLMPLAKYIPLTALAAILLVVAYKMVNWKVMGSIFRGTKQDILILIVTFALTVIFNVVTAVEVGMVVAALAFMLRMSKSLEIEKVSNANYNIDTAISNEILIKNIKGTLFFGSASILKDAIRNIDYSKLKVLIFRMKEIQNLDATSLNMLERCNGLCETFDVKFIITELESSDMELIKTLKNDKFILMDSVEEAVEYAKTILK